MDKWLTRFVLVITAVVLIMVPVKVNTRGGDTVPAPASRQSEDRKSRTEWTCGGRDGRPCKGGLERMRRYKDYIDAELVARGLPLALRYLPLIESDYNPLAVSSKGAAGLWQLMPETARSLGLKVNALVDERFDVYASTQAALDYLAALHDRFQCWSLALAAYNGGPTRVERAIRWHGGGRPRNDSLFLHIRDWLPRETRDFIPGFLASIRPADRSIYEPLIEYPVRKGQQSP